MKKIVAAALCGTLLFGACASKPDDIAAQYVSPVVYQGLTCDQIQAELVGIGGRVTQISGQQSRRASQDAWAVAGAFIVWPTLFFLMRDDKASELAKLKREYDALHSVALTKQCNLAPQRPAVT